jgi:excisionase family DNA binding protein
MPTTSPATTREFISLRDAATRTGFSVGTIRDKIDLGELPAYRISEKPNSALRVKLSDVDALMKHVEAAPPERLARWVVFFAWR